MTKTIPVGTLCMIVGLPDRKWASFAGPFTTASLSIFNGLTCTVIAHEPAHADGCTHVVDNPERCGILVRAIDPVYLLPIAPPGDPDRTTEPRREPEEVA